MHSQQTAQAGIKQAILTFLQEKGADTSEITEQSSLLEYIQSMDFVELIVHIESLSGTSLDMSTADIESLVTLGGFVCWATNIDA